MNIETKFSDVLRRVKEEGLELKKDINFYIDFI